MAATGGWARHVDSTLAEFITGAIVGEPALPDRCDGAARPASDEADQSAHLARRHACRRQSLFEPATEVIRKGNAGKPNEFGKMVKPQEAENQIVTEFR